MSYIIDGHNLIPKVPGLNLNKLDDEALLIEQLQVFSRVSRRKIEVFFDQAPPGSAGKHRAGTVLVHSVSQELTADEAILKRLRRLGGDARNWTLVTSDRRLQGEARQFRVRIVTSEEFSNDLGDALLRDASPITGESAKLNETQVEEWMRLFKERGSKKDHDSY
jgi:predicted RNA-binding protein with PIN domain